MDENNIKLVVGALIKKARIKQGLNQEKISALVDIDPTNYSKIERGISFPKFGTFCKIVEALKIEPNYFFDFISFEKSEQNPLDLELFSIIKALPDDVKGKAKDFLAALINN